MRASVISGCDAPPVVEFAEHVLDLVALLVDVGVVFDLLLAVFHGGIHGSISLLCRASLNQSAS